DRFPELKIVLVHGGGFLPYQFGRFDRLFAVREEARLNISRPPSSYLDRFWIDSITHSDQALRYLVDLVGTERVVVGTDFPFDIQDPEPVERLHRIGVDPATLGESTAALFGRLEQEPASGPSES